jgi:hypothetical protein
MSVTTFGSALSKIGVTVPEHLLADAEVPVMTGPQSQGDLIIIPAKDDSYDISTVELQPVPDGGIQVVVGEATGHTHWLHRGFESPGITFGRVDEVDSNSVLNGASLIEGVVHVPEGEVAELIHTDEHGCNAMGPGTYVIRGKREFSDAIARVAD